VLEAGAIASNIYRNYKADRLDKRPQKKAKLANGSIENFHARGE
jgi:hypothetical protein